LGILKQQSGLTNQYSATNKKAAMNVAASLIWRSNAGDQTLAIKRRRSNAGDQTPAIESDNR
jgi:hypothetical protein